MTSLMKKIGSMLNKKPTAPQTISQAAEPSSMITPLMDLANEVSELEDAIGKYQSWLADSAPQELVKKDIVKRDGNKDVTQGVFYADQAKSLVYKIEDLAEEENETPQKKSLIANTKKLETLTEGLRENAYQKVETYLKSFSKENLKNQGIKTIISKLSEFISAIKGFQDYAERDYRQRNQTDNTINCTVKAYMSKLVPETDRLMDDWKARRDINDPSIMDLTEQLERLSDITANNTVFQYQQDFNERRMN